VCVFGADEGRVWNYNYYSCNQVCFVNRLNVGCRWSKGIRYFDLEGEGALYRTVMYGNM
jgi:hypothetical protein